MLRSLACLVCLTTLSLAVGCNGEGGGSAARPTETAPTPPSATPPVSGSTATAGVSTASDPAPRPSTPLPPVSTPTAPASSLPAVVEAARQHLAQRLGVSAASIGIVTFERVDWPDGCLGYARPGEFCIQVITPGYRVLFAATVNGARTTFEYHTDLTRNFRPPP